MLVRSINCILYIPGSLVGSPRSILDRLLGTSSVQQSIRDRRQVHPESWHTRVRLQWHQDLPSHPRRNVPPPADPERDSDEYTHGRSGFSPLPPDSGGLHEYH